MVRFHLIHLLISYSVQTPQQAINLTNNVVARVRSGDSPNMRQALIHFRKDRKTLMRFRHIYYLSHINAALLNEVSYDNIDCGFTVDLCGRVHLNMCSCSVMLSIINL